MSKRLLKTMVALLAIAAAATGPAWAQTETLLTTITATAEEQASYSTANVATVSFSYTAGGSSAYLANWGWWGYGWIATVTAAEGYTITKCIFYDDANRTATDSEAPFVVETTEEDKTPRINGTPIDGGNMWSKGIKKIDVYGYVTPVPAVPHTVRFAAGNEGWSVMDVTAAASAVAPAVLENVMAGDSLVVTAPASLPGKVKSVKAVKYVPPAATVTTAPTATAAYIEVGSTAALVNAGAANGGTMMYAVTATNAQPASTADFSASIPTAQGRTAGTYYVWYYAKADAQHSDSEIAGPVSVTVTSATITVTINQSDWGSGYKSFTKDGVTVSADVIDSQDGNLMGGGTFSTTLGNFTKIVVTSAHCAASGTGWSGNRSSMTWAGTPASTVSFSGDFMGMGMSQTTIVCTIVPTN